MPAGRVQIANDGEAGYPLGVAGGRVLVGVALG